MSSNKILIPYQDKIFVVAHDVILFLKSDNYYTHIYLSNGRNYVIAKSLSKLEQEMQDRTFIRISQSFLVNAHFIVSIDKKKKVITLPNVQALPFTVPIKKLTALILDNKALLYFIMPILFLFI
jgi:two-component system LytT family response regulator